MPDVAGSLQTPKVYLCHSAEGNLPKDTVAEADRRIQVPLPTGEWSQTNATEKHKGPQLASPSLIPIHSTLETISLFLQEFQLILQITMSTFKYE